MSIESLNEMPSLLPLDFFAMEGTLDYLKSGLSEKQIRTKHLLPNTSSFIDEERFAEVAMGWNEEGIVVRLYADKPFEEADFPRFEQGDALELFIDTRDMKNAGFATRFCHHFLFLPQKVQGIHCQELTRFRSEDSHPLCDPSDLQIAATCEKRSYSLQIFLPRHCLYGYDPQEFDRLGFTYRVHRSGGQPQHFALSSKHFNIEQNPRLWASFKLRRG